MKANKTSYWFKTIFQQPAIGLPKN